MKEFKLNLQIFAVDERQILGMEECDYNCQATCQRVCQTVCESSCQSACLKSCQEQCEYLCQSTCELNCQSTCQRACQDACESSCQLECMKSCQEVCEHLCQSTCELFCQSTCEKACQTACESSCQNECMKSCQEVCEHLCQSTCELICQSTCERACQNACQKSCQSACLKSCQEVCEHLCQSKCQLSCQNCEGDACLSSCMNCEGDACLSSCMNCEGDVCQSTCQCEIENNQSTGGISKFTINNVAHTSFTVNISDLQNNANLYDGFRVEIVGVKTEEFTSTSTSNSTSITITGLEPDTVYNIKAFAKWNGVWYTVDVNNSIKTITTSKLSDYVDLSIESFTVSSSGIHQVGDKVTLDIVYCNDGTKDSDSFWINIVNNSGEILEKINDNGLPAKSCRRILPTISSDVAGTFTITCELDHNKESGETEVDRSNNFEEVTCTWQDYVKIDYDSALNKAIDITSSFEGSGYVNVTGNFDGQGLSVGIIQWNIGQQTLQPLFLKMNTLHSNLTKQIFGEKYEMFVNMLDSSYQQQMEWAISINDINNRVITEWRLLLIELCKTSEFQQIQVEGMKWWIDKAVSICSSYDLKTERSLALAFDIAVQNGGIKSIAKDSINSQIEGKNLEEKDLLAIIAIAVADALETPRWRDDVISRKMTIIDGIGLVHGTNYDLERDFGLGDKIIQWP